MTFSKSQFLKGGLIAVFAAGTLSACATMEPVGPRSYVVCNSAGDCWRVHRRYADYPADLGITYHDDAWWQAHQNEPNWHWQADRTDDHGWYDNQGVWHPYMAPSP